ncbi:hypothetical protein SK069_04875 [Patulibacter brassicae]|uniref:Uncharacterized protein n=2 Tax=Patulibacter brassicae TaxID=1705717 RepID=A0ABU4VJ26_9ACTN|nr:hypothetical protein [Patulibacter brassicae]
MRRTAVRAALAALVAAGVAPGAAAADAPVEWNRVGQYSCTTLGGLAASDAELAVRLSAPAGVARGGTLEASGSMRLTLESRAPGLVGLVGLSRSVRFAAPTIALPLRIATAGGPVERLVTVPDVRSAPTASPGLDRALAVRADLRLPPIVVPSDATGDLEIGLPRDGRGEDAALAGALRFEGGLVGDTPLSCRSGGVRESVVARIAVGPPAAGPATTPAPPPATTTAAAPAPRPRTRTAARVATPVPPAPSRPAAAAPAGDAPSTDATSPTASAAPPVAAVEDARNAGAWAPVPPATRPDDGDVVVPAWVLGVLLAGLLVGAAGGAVGAHRRLRRAQHELEDRP